MTGRMAAAEIPARNARHRAFVAVYPPERNTSKAWRVLMFEIPENLVDGYPAMEIS